MRNVGLALLVFGSLAVACGEIIPVQDQQTCPCAAGWTCCNGICVTEGSSCTACSGAIDLGSESVPTEGDASAIGSQAVTGLATKGTLPEETPVAFDYAESIWPTMYGWQFNGWVVTAGARESFWFKVWADQDGGKVQLDLAIYGPLSATPTDSDPTLCTGAMQGSAPMSGEDIGWTAPAAGTYFVAPYHMVTETTSGIAFQDFDDPSFSDAFIEMERTPAAASATQSVSK